MTTDYIADAITEAFGERCPDFAEGCACCEAWAQYDHLRTPAAPSGEIGELVEVWAAFEDGEARTGWVPVGYGDRAGWEALARRSPDKFTIETRHLVPAARRAREAQGGEHG